jgi:hypothetical protein
VTPHSARLRAKIEIVRPALNASARRLWSGPDLTESYPAYLRMMHTMIRATVPLMEVAIEQARAADPARDPVAAGVDAYLSKHLEEERGHDEWLRQDLAAIGRDPDEVFVGMPLPSVAALVGSQYYWIRHYHPVCLLGHIAVLEGYPPDPALADHIMARTGYPRTGLRTLIRHAALDKRHRDELMAAIDGLPLRTADEHAIGLSALHTVQGLIAVLDDMIPAAGPAPAATEVAHV